MCRHVQVQYSTVQYSTVQHSTAQYMMMFSLSLLLLAAASNVIMIYLGRVCCGLCTGEQQIIVEY